MLNKKDAEYLWFRFCQTTGIGPKAIAFAYRNFLLHSNSIEEIKGLDHFQLAQKFPGLMAPIFSLIFEKDRERIRINLNTIKDADLTIIHPDSEYYPVDYLKSVEKIGAPAVFFAKGNLSLLKEKKIAIIGTRHVSNEGIILTKKITSSLSSNGINIISGYARGVDLTSHLSSLENGGTTTFVLGYGINDFKLKTGFEKYSFEKNMLAVTQFLPVEKWTAYRAMSRNKLICALADAVIVIESGPEKDNNGKRSGTFDSARKALELGKKLYVVSPSQFTKKPGGNADIIQIGGIELFPDNVFTSMFSHRS